MHMRKPFSTTLLKCVKMTDFTACRLNFRFKDILKSATCKFSLQYYQVIDKVQGVSCAEVQGPPLPPNPTEVPHVSFFQSFQSPILNDTMQEYYA